MSKATHTPGPWAVDGLDIEADGEKVASAAVSMDLDRYEEFQANARLISAAPELLDLLTDALLYIEAFAPGYVRRKAVRAAIAKARGQSEGGGE